MSYKPRQTTPAIDRLMALVWVDAKGCWIAGQTKSYLSMNCGRRGEGKDQAHRISYRAFVGPIPEGLVIDHLCRDTRCVNPDHLEAVTNRENIIRGNARFNGAHQRLKTECVNGHPYNERNTYRDRNGHRHCAECGRIASLASYHRNKAAS